MCLHANCSTISRLHISIRLVCIVVCFDPIVQRCCAIFISALMEIKGFSQCIAANKQQWCGLVAAASCGIVAACEFFVCKLVLLLLVAATLQLLVAATLQLLAAVALRLLVAATLQLFVCRECVGLVIDCF